MSSSERTEPFWVCDDCEGVWFGNSIGPLPEGDLETLFDEIGHTTHWVGMSEAPD